MKQQVLKALANPAHIFYVPYELAVINFVVQFIIYIVVFIVALVVWKEGVSPLWFLLSVIGVHFILMGISKKDPQIGQILSSKFQLIKRRIPKRLVV